HDAQRIAHLVPIGMIFVPSRGGISHSPREYTAPEDAANGVEVLYRTLLSWIPASTVGRRSRILRDLSGSIETLRKRVRWRVTDKPILGPVIFESCAAFRGASRDRMKCGLW